MNGAKNSPFSSLRPGAARLVLLATTAVVLSAVLSGCQIVVDDDGFNVVTGPSGNEATQVVEQVFPAVAVKELRIDNVRGSVRVESWDRSDVGVTMTKKVRGLASPHLKNALDDVKVEVGLNEGKARLAVRLPDKVPDYVTGYQVDFVLRVPNGRTPNGKEPSGEPASEPAVRGGGANGSNATNGATAAGGKNGDKSAGAAGATETAPATKRLTIRTTGGEVRVEAGREALSALKVLDITTSAAEVWIADVNAQVIVSTTNGRVHLVRAAGDFDVRTTNGEIVLDRVTLKKEAIFQTANAPITARIAEAGSGKYTFRTSNAAVELYWPLLAGARFELSGGNVSVSQNMALTRVEQGLTGLRGTLGDGRGQVTAVTPNGSLYLRSYAEAGL